ncbi:MAG: hypothetical protein JW718_11685 [Desulfovibrionaceae bacterium]|nr:hypothetical protein [Desulfovibrionaceae bacterium]
MAYGLALLLGLAPACGPTAAKAPAEVKVPAGGRDLAGLLAGLLKEQYPALKKLYAPPPDALFGRYALEIAREPAVLHLAEGVTAFSAQGDGLAAGLENGNVLVWSAWPCPGLSLPLAGPVRVLAFSPQSRFLAACSEADRLVRVFDLGRCARVRDLDLGSEPVLAAVSGKAEALAVAGEDNSIWAGPAQGPLARLEVLDLAPVGLGFSPGQGLLLAVDQAGTTTAWNLRQGSRVDRFRIPGGPFVRARFSAGLIGLERPSGEELFWDLVRGGPAPEPNELRRFFVRDRVLYYKTFKDLPVRKAHLGPVRLGAEYCAQRGAILVRDLDGRSRCFDAGQGRPGPCPGDCAWQALDLDQDGRFKINGRGYALADAVYQREHDRLLCRRVPGGAYYLWWVKAERPDWYDPLPGHLPERATILDCGQIGWTPLDLPADMP